jgi:subtilase family serine protease
MSAAAVTIPSQVSAAPDQQGPSKNSHDVSCADENRAGYAKCHSKTRDRSDSDPRPFAGPSPYGLSPDQIKMAYGFSGDPTAGTGQTIAIVDAYHSATAASDLAQFSSYYGLPQCPAGSCFTQVDQTGGTSYPAVDGGWGLEIALDVQWAHAIAPAANILLVEATTNSFANLMAAEDYARSRAQYVTNSWGGNEFLGESLYDSHFTTPSGASKVSFFVSAGDAGLPAEYPSSSPNVISVGGTTLSNITPTTVKETAWSDGGGGCSKYETATSAQSSFAEYGQAGCGGRRATPDVSLDADPASGVSVYDTTPYSGSTGWWAVGGTSASSPMWAARAAVAGVPVDSTWVYKADSSQFRDITSGNNGAAAKVGYDLASGRGSWIDSSAPLQLSPPPAPVASFSTSCNGSTKCTFTSTSTGNNLTYNWGGAVSGSGSTTNATFPNRNANYTVTLTVSNTGGSNTASKTVSCRQSGRRGSYTCS